MNVGDFVYLRGTVCCVLTVFVVIFLLFPCLNMNTWGDSRCVCFVVIVLNPVDISDQADASHWCLILTAGRKPRVIQNGVLRRTFGLKRYAVTGELRGAS